MTASLYEFMEQIYLLVRWKWPNAGYRRRECGI